MKSKQQLRIEALNRLSTLSYNDYVSAYFEKNGRSPEFAEYEAYVERKHAEKEILKQRIGKIIGNA